MKHIQILISCLLVLLLTNIFMSQAQMVLQPNTNGFPSLNSGRRLVDNILQQQYTERNKKLTPVGKTTSPGAHERLIAYSGYNFQDTSAFSPWGISDSGYFYYSGENGSVFNYQTAAYSLSDYPYGGLPSTNISSPAYLYLHYNTFIYKGAEVMPDSEAMWNDFCADSSGYIFGVFGKTDYTYTGHNIATLFRSYTNPYPGSNYRQQLNYDTLGEIVSFVQSVYDTATLAWDTSYIRLSYYDTSGNLVMDSSSVHPGDTVWYPQDKSIYAYDLFHNLTLSEVFLDSNYTSGIWQPYQKLYLSYNTDHTLHSDSISKCNTGLWYPYMADSFGYTTGISYYTFHRMYEFGFVSPYYISIDSKHISLSGLPDTVYFQSYGNYTGGSGMKMMSGKKSTYFYDSYSNPVWASMYNYIITDSITGAGYYDTATEREFHYYYETYGAALAAHSIKSAKELITLYPNPTNGSVTISRPDALKGSNTQILISNAAGQTLRTVSLPWMNESETLSLSGLLEGVYILTLEDGRGDILFTEKIVKL